MHPLYSLVLDSFTVTIHRLYGNLRAVASEKCWEFSLSLQCISAYSECTVSVSVHNPYLDLPISLVMTPANQMPYLIVRRAGLLWSQRDFEWRWSVPLFKCLTVLEFSFILFDLCLLITFFNFIMNYVPIVTFWIFTYHKIRILSIMFCSIWSYWIIYFLACLEVSWRVVS